MVQARSVAAPASAAARWWLLVVIAVEQAVNQAAGHVLHAEAPEELQNPARDATGRVATPVEGAAVPVLRRAHCAADKAASIGIIRINWIYKLIL